MCKKVVYILMNHKRRIDIDAQKEQIIELLNSGVPQRKIASDLKCKSDTLKVRLSEWNVGHLKNQARSGLPHPEAYISATKYLVENSTNMITSHKLKLKLIKEGLKEHRCESCQNTHWMGRPTPIELDHMNGIKTDNRIENLRLLCPNCHAQTDNYKSKNTARYKAGLAKLDKAEDLKSLT